MKKKRSAMYKFLALLVILTVGVFCIRYFDLFSLLKIDVLRECVYGFGMYAPLVFVLLFACAVVFFVPATPLVFAGAALFGPAKGLPLVFIGALGGAILSFLLARFLGESLVSSLLRTKSARLYAYDEQLSANGFSAVLLLRLIPLFPFNPLNIAFGLSEVRFSHYFFGTCIGMLPSLVVYTYLGGSLFTNNVFHSVLAIVFWAILVGFGIWYSFRIRMSRRVAGFSSSFEQTKNQSKTDF